MSQTPPTATTPPQAHYRFGPLERTTLLFGLTGAQLSTLLLGAILGLVALHMDNPYIGGPLALVLAGIAVWGTFWPVGGRSAVEWLPALARWAYRRATGKHRFLSFTPLVGHPTISDVTADVPESLAGISILSAPVAGGELGVIKEKTGHTYAAVISVRGRSFSLLDSDAKARLLAQWADVLAGLGRQGSLVRRLQWVERTVPDTGDGVASYLRDSAVLPGNHPATHSYLQLVQDAGPATHQHETFVVVQIDALRARKAMRTAGGGDTGACAVLAREVHSLATRLQGADLDVVGILTPRLVAQVLRVGFDPASRSLLARRNQTEPDDEVPAAHETWPHATVTTWATHRTDSAVHATYWVSEWPRTDVGPDFLAPLLLQTRSQRSVSVTLEPVSPLRAQRQVESARTARIADEELRQRAGFVVTKRRQREHEHITRREEELADGHSDVRFSGYITVSARDDEELDMACAEIEQQAAHARLVLRRLVGEQDVAFTYTLPLARGLR